MAIRILVTGSRDWTDKEIIKTAAVNLLNKFEDQELTLVSGACPNGADRLAEEIWVANRIGPIELHPANWELYGKRAGFIRNAEMVYPGADVCIAFIKNESKGSTMTADLAEKAGIETWRFTTVY